jgi:hypothetical protein
VAACYRGSINSPFQPRRYLSVYLAAICLAMVVAGCSLFGHAYQPSRAELWCDDHPDELYAAAHELDLIDTAPPEMRPSPLSSGITVGFEGITDYFAACQRAYDISLLASPTP